MFTTIQVDLLMRRLAQITEEIQEEDPCFVLVERDRPALHATVQGLVSSLKALRVKGHEILEELPPDPDYNVYRLRAGTFHIYLMALV